MKKKVNVMDLPKLSEVRKMQATKRVLAGALREARRRQEGIKSPDRCPMAHVKDMNNDLAVTFRDHAVCSTCGGDQWGVSVRTRQFEGRDKPFQTISCVACHMKRLNPKAAKTPVDAILDKIGENGATSEPIETSDQPSL